MKKRNKDYYETFGGIYPSEYANPRSKYYEGKEGGDK